jgi:hypothetical protein
VTAPSFVIRFKFQNDVEHISDPRRKRNRF